MVKLQNVDGEIKAVGQLRLNGTQKLIALAMRLLGTSNTNDLCEATGESKRTVQKAKLEIATLETNEANRANSANYDSRSEGEPSERGEPWFAKDANSANYDSSSDSGIPPRAYKENPSGLNISSSKLASSAHMREIEGLNGSTTMWVEKLANWLAGDLGTPNLITARTLIESSVDCYGPQQVKIGMLELEAKIASGEKFRNLANGFSQFVKNAKHPKTEDGPDENGQYADIMALCAREPWHG
ncbi:MAG: hypothetical protein K0U61_13680 [Alphaproteobacteria bacterium]|nr:hypothetical protein [Alphaproteobacteria bacterium]